MARELHCHWQAPHFRPVLKQASSIHDVSLFSTTMDPLLLSAASGMKARMESLDMLANNVANAGTAGFKADREFYGVFQAGMPSGDLPMIERHWTDFSQGMLLPTGNQLDLALDGDGFFALNGPAPAANTAGATPSTDASGTNTSAPPNQIVFSRSGRFQISRNNQLATAEGFTLRNTRDQGRPITVDPTKPIDIDGTGIVKQDGQELGQLEIGGIADPSKTLAKLGTGYFARLTSSTTTGPTPAVKPGVIKQGSLEQSNVGATDAAVRLVGVMRQFEMMQRAMALGTEMNKRALDEVARFS
jgi:flagellar basal body rod protein FlgG